MNVETNAACSAVSETRKVWEKPALVTLEGEATEGAKPPTPTETIGITLSGGPS